MLTTGLAATLQEEGFAARAVKPICLCGRQEAQAELSFISSISKTPLTYPVQILERAASLSSFAWGEALRSCNSGTEPTLVELPGSCATPMLRPHQGSSAWKDAADMASELSWPCLLVARAGADAVEKLLLNAVYLSSRSLTVLGLVIVETVQDQAQDKRQLGALELIGIGLQERVGVPLVGCLRYSPSISVPRVSQGNLIKTTSSGLDLLPILKALNLRVSV